MTLWPIFEFIAAFSLGVGVGSWDLIRVKVGARTQTPARRHAVILQTCGIVMLVLVGSTTYEQHHDADCQTVRNQQFADGIEARANAQSRYIEADIAFIDADEAWVSDQIAVVNAARGHALTPAEQDRLLDRWNLSLTAKLTSAQAKQQALRDLRDARGQYPVGLPDHDC